jgi:ankyrin repeat protein
MLIEHGADVTARAKNGKTPLDLVSQENQVGFTHMFLERNTYVLIPLQVMSGIVC